MRKVLLLPYWSNGRCCWRREAENGFGPNSYHDCSSSAAWRQTRRQSGQYLEELRRTGVEPSKFFSIPNMEEAHIMIDWLHTIDLGLSQDVVGNVFWYVVPKLGVANQEENIRRLWARILAFYKENSTPSRLQSITRDMIKDGAEPPKLRSKAAECRYLVPLAAQLARENASGVEGETIMHVTQHLNQLYEFIRMDEFPVELASETCRRMCILLSALEEHAMTQGSICWRMKPKAHLVQELLEYQTTQEGNPKLFWTYRDEDWGGWLSRCAQRRGGHATPESVSLQVLRRFMIAFKTSSGSTGAR